LNHLATKRVSVDVRLIGAGRTFKLTSKISNQQSAIINRSTEFTSEGIRLARTVIESEVEH